MTRLPAIALAVAGVAFATLTPAVPQARAAPYFVAELAQAVTQGEAIAGGVLFRCEGTICTGSRSGARVLRVCSELRREVGTIASFSAGGTLVTEDELARCNG